MFSKIWTRKSTPDCSQPEQLKKALHEADAVIIGAGAGLSTSAGFTYAGERFRTYFSDFASKYGFTDMYSGGFYPYSTMEEYWAYWSRYIYINRYQNAPKPVYDTLLRLVQDKDHFVITTNVDHCFQKAGFDKKRLFYTHPADGRSTGVCPRTGWSADRTGEYHPENFCSVRACPPLPALRQAAHDEPAQ